MGSGEERRMKRSKLAKTSTEEITRLAYTHLQKGDAQRATECFESAADKARQEGKPEAMISCYLNAGACLVSRGQLTQGNAFLLSALRLTKSQKLDESISRRKDGKETKVSIMEISADINFNLAIAAKKVQKHKKAIYYFRASADLYLKSGCVMHAAESYSNLAHCHRKTQERHKEVACLVKAQHLYHEAEDSYNEAECCLELARTYLRENLMDDCKEMLSTAKLLCLRVDNRSHQGKLYTEFGLIYTSMGLYDLGIQNFERALPLVRESTGTEQSLQAEASLLQNIGAAYNEKALFLEAMVYHKEAVAIHGKVHNHNSESKSLCNLAYAQTQLNQLQEAAKTFSNALTKAHKAKNSFLQFQTCEGLGSINHQMGRFDEAISYFRQALEVLDQIREDTGIARERVMEKLSETTEALHNDKEQRVESSHSTGEDEALEREVMRTKLHSIASASEEYTTSKGQQSMSKSLSSSKGQQSMSKSLSSGEDQSKRSLVSPPEDPNDRKCHSLTITERRGAKSLPPLKTRSEPTTNKHAVLTSKKGKQKMRLRPVDMEPELDLASEGSEYSADLQAYMNSYLSSTNTASISLWSQDVQRQMEGVGTPPAPTRMVREGSLAIGENARDTYTVQTIQEWSQGKGGKKKQRTRSEIIHVNNSPISSSDSEPPTQEYKRQKSTETSKNKSKICTIL